MTGEKQKSVDYPDGDGQPNCQWCKGRGVILATTPPGVVVAGEHLRPCQCVRHRDILANVERGWRGLTQAAKIPESLLFGRGVQSLWITATVRTFKAHLRHVAIRSGTDWRFVVVSDADLMDAWLSRIDDRDIYDGDVEVLRKQPVTSKYGALVDMVEPPQLLIIVAGVKAARNSAMHEVVMEALRHREHINKPTWVVDQPDYPLANGHISYSPQVGEFLRYLPHLKLKKLSSDKTTDPAVPPVPTLGVRMMSFAESALDAQTPVVDHIEEPQDIDAPPVKKPKDARSTRSELDNIPTESSRNPYNKKKGGSR